MSGRRLNSIERKHIRATRKFIGKQARVVTEQGEQSVDDATMFALFKAERELVRIGK